MSTQKNQIVRAFAYTRPKTSNTSAVHLEILGKLSKEHLKNIEKKLLLMTCNQEALNSPRICVPPRKTEKQCCLSPGGLRQAKQKRAIQLCGCETKPPFLRWDKTAYFKSETKSPILKTRQSPIL